MERAAPIARELQAPADTCGFLARGFGSHPTETMLEPRRSYRQAGPPVEELASRIGNRLRLAARRCATEACAPPGERPALAQDSVSPVPQLRFPDARSAVAEKNALPPLESEIVVSLCPKCHS